MGFGYVFLHFLWILGEIGHHSPIFGARKEPVIRSLYLGRTLPVSTVPWLDSRCCISLIAGMRKGAVWSATPVTVPALFLLSHQHVLKILRLCGWRICSAFLHVSVVSGNTPVQINRHINRCTSRTCRENDISIAATGHASNRNCHAHGTLQLQSEEGNAHRSCAGPNAEVVKEQGT